MGDDSSQDNWNTAKAHSVMEAFDIDKVESVDNYGKQDKKEVED